ncbi:GIY-YIG nuclease family protein [Simiduia sp. 21SJ11W-1]|uniref:GIY-YIG nuclease family protein n=1 Tax=Simiduia sp. 21SJ11W-1 TaxID=2909669 RepID=UPI0020A1EBAD|nr:GIY-YIG nuclease family protein [Simiduia sp. 21SJ11W-1]UTA46495.1 GIY-YIG nuclease family protein [Simiduia sp. 21SJ11W-1]
MTNSNAPNAQAQSKLWFVYIIETSDQRLYTGITTDVQRRFEQHAMGRGAKFFRGRRPVRVCYRESHPDRSSASKREWHIKQLSRRQKQQLIDQPVPSMPTYPE